jgi:hypothetical protein
MGIDPRIAFLVMAHTDPQAVRRLCDRLNASWATIYIHIDARADIAPFQALVPETERRRFLQAPLRVRVNWAGYTQVIAEQNLFAAALQHPGITRCCLLSGADYPIKPLSQIGTALDVPGEIISIDREVDGRGATPQDHFVRHRFFGDIAVLNERKSRVPLLPRLAKSLSSRFTRLPPPGLRLFHGANWCALTREGMQRLVEMDAADPQLAAFLRRTQSADEFAAQSLVMRAPALPVRQLNGADNKPRRIYGIHYVDWTNQRGGAPKVLVDEDFAALAETSALFARKFDPHFSGALLDRIDTDLLETAAVALR